MLRTFVKKSEVLVETLEKFFFVALGGWKGR